MKAYFLKLAFTLLFFLGVSKRALVVIDYANSEIGVIQDVSTIVKIAHKYDCVVYMDCTASINTIPLNVQETDIDMCGFSAHKLGALKGSGIFYKKHFINIEPIIYGEQESGLIGGTQNVLGIASLYKAIKEHDYSSISPQNRDYVYNYIIKNIPGVYIVGGLNNRLSNNLYMCFRGVEGESLMILLDLNRIQVSTGSACNSKKIESSPVLKIIGMPEGDRKSCIRMTFSGTETKHCLDFVCKTLKQSVDSLRQIDTTILN